MIQISRFVNILSLIPLICLTLPAAESKKEKTIEVETPTREKSVEEKLAPAKMSKKYRQGRYLIYDCKDRHFACVNEENFVKCRRRRERALEWKRDYLPCAPLKKFESPLICVQNTYQQIHRPKRKVFCVNEKKSEKN